MRFEVRQDDLSGADVQALIAEHLAGMYSHSPPESVHALALDGLKRADLTFWSVWCGPELCGCGALKELDALSAEVKSMRTRSQFLRQGVAQAALAQILATAAQRGYQRLFLETGTGEAFEPAQRLYLRHGFEFCGPFGDYKADPFSVFMVKLL
jgi:putative acetyltransferase